LYSHECILLAATHRDYVPRPTLQSYAAFTPRLAELNAAHLRGDRAPDSILFRLQAIDFRWPALEDGPSWLEMVARYKIGEFRGNYALLTRAATTRRPRLEPLATIDSPLGAPVQLPDAGGDLLYASIDVHPTLLHGVANTLFASPMLHMVAELSDGRVVIRRFIPGMGRAGFVLSPFVASTHDFMGLWNPDPQRLAADRVTKLSIGVRPYLASQVEPTKFYDGMTLTLYRVRFESRP
jgi:hypothetical protein